MKLTSKKLATTVGATLIALAVSGGAMAKGKGRASFERMDTDSSGTIELQEMIDANLARVAKRFEKLDTDADSFISFEEYTANRSDDAVDLSLYADEIVQCVEDVKADSGDENIQVPEASDFLSAEDKFAAKDSNGDGFISLDEAETSAETSATTKFTNLDTNGDGSLTSEELTANKDSRKATRSAIKDCIEEVTADDEVL